MKNTLQKISSRHRLLFLSTLLIIFITSCNREDDPVELTFGSWRTDDVEEMNQIFASYNQSHESTTIKFDPIEVTAYETTTLERLSKGEGADLILLRPYDKGHEVYAAGYLSEISDLIPNLSDFSTTSKSAWNTDAGVQYGVPSVGVTHGIYYNKTIFSQFQLEEPVTWEQFLSVCETLSSKGITPIAQGIVDEWTLYELIFCGLGANFYGGESARQALMAGTQKLTDPSFVETFEMVNSLKKYFPEQFSTLDYEGARDLFGNGQAAMFISGSWEISAMEGYGFGTTTLGWFAPPVKQAGDKLQYVFHVDAAIGLNKNTQHKKEASEFLLWLASSDYAQALMTYLPGFFTYTPGGFTIGHPLASKMFETAKTADLTIRLMSEKLSSKSPAGNTLMGETLAGMLSGKFTPATAAAWAQQQLESQSN